MSLRSAIIARLLAALVALTALAALSSALPAAAPGAATSSAAAPSAATASREAIKALLDEVEQGLKSEFQTDEALADLRRRLSPARSDLRDMIDGLEPELDRVVAGLKQLGDPPAPGTGPEDGNIAAERARLTHEEEEIETALKQARLLSLRAEEINARLNEARRALFTRELLARSIGLFNPAFWREVADAVRPESARVGQLFRSWWIYAQANGTRGGWIGAGLTLAGFAVVLALLLRWRRRWAPAHALATRFERAAAAMIALVGQAVAVPAAMLVSVLVLENYALMPAWVRAIWVGVAAAVAAASFGRGVAVGLFAPAQPGRRLWEWSDGEAAVLARHLTWGARILGLAVLLDFIHKTTAAAVSVTVATSALLALAIITLAVHFVWVTARPGGAGDRPFGPGVRGVRILLVASVVAIGAALAAGYIAMAAFVAGRLLVLLMIGGAVVIADAFVESLFADVLAGHTERGRAVAALLGLSARGLDLSGALLSALVRLLLLAGGVLFVLGPWGVFADDVLGALAEAAFGWQVGGVAVSIQNVLGALALIILGILAVRAGQRWLELSLLPRTGLDPGLQHSISALFGYAALIAVVSLALATLGIDLQKIALIAGALSVGIGFGLQSIVSNFVSGLILLAERPIRVGDWVVVKNEEGFVRRISVRATEIETFDRASVIIPNSEFITGVVKNWTHANTMGRVTIKVRVAYDTDVDRVQDILAESACEHPKVLKTPPPRVFLLGFGDIALEFELRCILANVEDALQVKSDLHQAILQRFRAARIRVPFPPHEERVPGELPPLPDVSAAAKPVSRS